MKTPLRILHLEDDRHDAELVQAALEEGGIACNVTRVETRDDFEAALEKGGVDLILADHKLPSFDGPSALAIADEKHPEIPFIFVSGTMGEELAIETIKNGATDYVLKQRLSRIVPAVRRALKEVAELNLRKKAEDSLEKLMRQNELILNSVGEGIFGLDSEGKHTLVNPAAAEMLGYEIEELIGKDSHEICHHSRADGSPYPRKECPIYMAYKDGLVHHVRDEVFWRKDGTSFFVAYISTPIIENGKLAGAVVTFRNITERKLAEEELRKHRDHLEELVHARTLDLNEMNEQLRKEIVERIQAEEQIRLMSGRLEFLLSSNPAVIYTARADDDFTTMFITRNVAEVLGYKPREFLDTPAFWKEHVHPDDLRMLSHELSRFFEQGRHKMEYRFKSKDGRYVWIYDEAQLIKDESGKLIEIIGFLMDITDRKYMEETLQRREHEIRVMANNVPALFSYIDRDCTFRFVNKRYEEWFQISRGEIIGRHVRHIIGEPAYEAVKDKIEAALSGRKVACEVAVPYEKGGARWMSIKYVPDVDNEENVKGFYSLAMDISERKHAEEELRHLTDELKRSNADLKQFAYAASHDLQEPLRNIEGFVKLLEKRYKGKFDEKADEFFGYITGSVSRMQTLIKDLLEYSRVGTKGKTFRPVNCADAIEQALSNLHTAIEETKTEVTLDPLPTLMADVSQLVRLFQNLIGNALKFCGREPPKVRISAEQKGNDWVFSVRDNGIGIDPKHFERIFAIFQRLHTREEYEGTGIGLSLCKKIVERHGGRIWVESEPGKGATFYFTIPAIE